ncbi:MAG TPA: dipeptidase [Solirubrobacteraceae bacterium]
MIAVFDGHNDALGALQKAGDPPERFLTGLPDRQLDLARARAGGLAGGLFAIHVPSPRAVDTSLLEVAYAEPVGEGEAAAFALGAIGRAHALAAASDGDVAVVTSVDELDRARADGTLAMVLHLEGAEAIGPDLASLEAWHAVGVRSIGPVWSRANAFGHGVPFRFPSSPDTGPGLTEAGRRLVGRCAELGLAVDVSHLNAAGFADVAALDGAPIIASHCACHALCASTRNLTDDQLRAIARSDGIVGIVYAAAFIRPDGRDDADVPLATLVEHVRHAVEVAGVEHVGLGSDFDGATMPAELADVAALPRLIDALRDAGFTAAEIDQIAWGNWRRILALAWGS